MLNDPFQGGGGARRRARCSRRRWNSTPIRPRSARFRCALPHPPHRTRSLAPAERYSRIARPASRRRSVRSACARTFTNPPTADGIRLLDPLTGLNQPDSAPRGHRDASASFSSEAALCGYAGMAVEEGRRTAGRARRPLGRAGRAVALSMRARREAHAQVREPPRVCVSGRSFVCRCVCMRDVQPDMVVSFSLDVCE